MTNLNELKLKDLNHSILIEDDEDDGDGNDDDDDDSDNDKNVTRSKQVVINKGNVIRKTKENSKNKINISTNGLNGSSIEMKCIENNLGSLLASKFPFYFYKMRVINENDDNQDNLIKNINKNVETNKCKIKAVDTLNKCDSHNKFWNHPKVRENWRVFFAAFGLLIVGIALITMGIVVTLIPNIDFQSYVFFIAGAICFIPGAYHVVYVLCAIKGRKGYDFYQLPLFT